jgi:hypothetical protein
MAKESAGATQANFPVLNTGTRQAVFEPNILRERLRRS